MGYTDEVSIDWARHVIVAAFAGVALLAMAGKSSAQGKPAPLPSTQADKRTVRLDARAGIALPTADMRDYVDEGPVLSAGVAYRLTDRLSVRGDWTAALMRPADRTPLNNKGVHIPQRGSETDLHHVTAGVQVELSEPGKADIEVRAHGGLGVTFLFTEETELAQGGEFTQFTLDAGLELAVPLGGGVRFIGRGDLYVLPFRAGAPKHLLKEVVLPFSGGFSIGI